MSLKVQHNLAEFSGIERGGSVSRLPGTQRRGQFFRGVPRSLAGGDGIAAYLAAHICQSAASAQFSGLPQRFNGVHNVLGGNVRHGLGAEGREEIFRHSSQHEGTIAVFTVKGFPFVPFHSHGLERSVGGRCSCGLPVFRRVNAVLEQGLGFIPALPCGAERYLGILAEGKELGLSLKTVRQPPEFFAAGRNKQKQPTSVRILFRFVGGFQALNNVVIQHSFLRVRGARKSS